MAAPMVASDGPVYPKDVVNCGSPLAMVFAAACVPSGKGLPLASNTTTDVSAGTDPVKVEVSAAAVLSVAGVPVEDAEVLSGAVELSVEAGACVEFVAAAWVSFVPWVVEEPAEDAPAEDVLEEDEACVLFEPEELSPDEAGADAGGGGLSSARTITGWTALANRTSSVKLLINKK